MTNTTEIPRYELPDILEDLRAGTLESESDNIIVHDPEEDVDFAVHISTYNEDMAKVKKLAQSVFRLDPANFPGWDMEPSNQNELPNQ